jgi:hypothetical protein
VVYVGLDINACGRAVDFASFETLLWAV